MSKLHIKTRATFSWGGDPRSNQLGFMEGDVIDILKVVNDSVYFGESQRTKLKGFFPSDYVDNEPIMDELNKTNNSSTPSTPTSIGSKNNSSNSLFTLRKKDTIHNSNSNTDISTLIDNDRLKSPQSSEIKNPELKSSKKFTSSYVQQLLDSSTLSTDTNTSSTFGHSDFSATSAGSFMRHKDDYESKLHNLMNSNIQYNTSTRNALNDIIEKNEKKKSSSNLFKNFLGSRIDEGPSFDDRIYLSSVEKMTQMNINDASMYEHHQYTSPAHQHSQQSLNFSDAERTKTISGHDRAKRKERVLGEQPDLILKPQECINHVNYEERDASALMNRSASYNLDRMDFSKVDRYIDKIEHNPYDSPQKFTKETILRKFKRESEVCRAIYNYLTKNFSLVTRPDEIISTKRMFESHKLTEIMHSKTCTPHQLTWMFYLMADTAGLEVEIILGYLKHPFVLNETITDAKKRLIINHSWISIKVDGEYRFVDVSLGNPTNEFSNEYSEIWDTSSTRKFYFLARPFHLIHTHSPRFIDQQHIVPPIDIVAQLSLPPLYPHSMIEGISLHKFNTSLFHLKDLELYDFELEVPEDYIVQGKFKPYDKGYNTEDSFVQFYYRNNKRIAHFQGIMSKNCPVGFVYVTGKSEFSRKWNLLMSIPCFHQGKWKPLQWVKKVPGLNGVDVYLKEPKINNLKMGEQKFDIRVFGKADWVKEVKKFYHGVLKLGLFSPSKDIIELDIYENKYTGKINLNQPGIWRLGVLDVKQRRWKIISEWNIE
ncbi:Cyk3 protein [Pichia kluyveri]|uniref:Cyk3 protein n=1 Tax=Pichia kluyveri TaxID=36015 RepID=A0AAV5R9J4_PICKL|nr:Cyk3 protein [Pichia kluyveri]